MSVALAIVAVLYFDNNTNNADLDVMKKGFADMLVTDLSSVKEISVVEREKLEALLSELKLQKTKYFDPATAQKLGRGLGATHAVTGSFAALDPEMRIDIRLIEIQSGKVVVADKVIGKKTDLFALESELVRKFTEGLDVKLAGKAPASKTRVPSLDSLLDYSKSVDLADQGKIEDANEAMNKVVRASPTFVLARLRLEELKKKLGASKERRVEVIGQGLEELIASTEAHLKGDFASLELSAAKEYLAYRSIRGHLILRGLKQYLPKKGQRVILPGKEKEALAAIRAYAANLELNARELEAYAAKHTVKYPNNTQYLDTSYRVTEEDSRRLRAAGMDGDVIGTPFQARLALADFLLLGAGDDSSDDRIYGLSPAPAELDPKLAAAGWEAIKRAWELGDERAKSDHKQDFDAIRALQQWGEALVLRNKTEEAIAKWQEALDRYPTSTQFGQVERRIKIELGMEFYASHDDFAKFPAAVEACDDMGMRKGIGETMAHRVRTQGMAAVPVLVAEIEKACKDSKLRSHFWEYLYSHTALFAGGIEHCALFEVFMKKYLEVGGSQSSVDAYRKNYAGSCAK